MTLRYLCRLTGTASRSLPSLQAREISVSSFTRPLRRGVRPGPIRCQPRVKPLSSLSNYQKGVTRRLICTCAYARVKKSENVALRSNVRTDHAKSRLHQSNPYRKPSRVSFRSSHINKKERRRGRRGGGGVLSESGSRARDSSECGLRERRRREVLGGRLDLLGELFGLSRL